MNKKIFLASIFIFSIIITGCSTVSAVESKPIGNPELGRELFENGDRLRCTHCHTLDGSDRRGGPSLLGISERAGGRIPELSEIEYLQQSILEPSVYIVEGFEDKMPAYQLVDPEEVDFITPGMLTQEELDNLIAFLLTQ